MSCRTSIPLDPQSPKRKVQLILDDDQIRLRPDLQLFHQLPYRNATQVHERLGLGQHHRFFADLCPCGQCPAIPVPYFYIQIVSQLVDSQKTQIMRRELIFNSRIAKSNNQFHVGRWSLVVGRWQKPGLKRPDWPTTKGRRPTTILYFFSFFSAGASPSSSVSCLPFLMTSGSAGAAAASPATASGVATTSSLMLMMCATGWSASVKKRILSFFGRSATRNTTPNTRSATLSSIALGMSAGKHSISTSRTICSRSPPCVFTPSGWPTSSIGTF